MGSIIIGTRGSKLALYQAEKVREALSLRFPDLIIEIKVYKTLGDRQPELNLLTNQGRGIFCGEIETALLNGAIDLAVHSVKDLPGDLLPGLVLAAYLEREDHREVLVGKDNLKFNDLPAGARIGTSSIRRMMQLKAKRKDLLFLPIRGNVETRVGKAQSGDYEAIVLALAGLRRIGLEDCISEIFPTDQVIPAPGQGCIGVEIRENDHRLKEIVSAVNHWETSCAVRAERAFLRKMGGNCESAVGAIAHVENGVIEITGLFGESEERIKIESVSGTVAEPEVLGYRLAEKIIT